MYVKPTYWPYSFIISMVCSTLFLQLKPKLLACDTYHACLIWNKHGTESILPKTVAILVNATSLSRVMDFRFNLFAPNPLITLFKAWNPYTCT